jgi:uncharacterized protein YjiS (DUF1127 family)
VWANNKDDPMFITSILSAVHRWLRYRNTLQELSRLTDRELNDLGIHRSDIAGVAWRGR